MKNTKENSTLRTNLYNPLIVNRRAQEKEKKSPKRKQRREEPEYKGSCFMSAIAICMVLVSMATTWSKTLISNGFEIVGSLTTVQQGTLFGGEK